MLKPATDLALSPAHRSIVAQVLRRHAAHAQVLAYGSRVQGTARKYSDLDLAIIAPQPLTLRALRQLREAFEDSDLPICVDLTDWSQADPGFKAAVVQQGMAVVQ
jgi:uncharacterized protein